ncbi:MAG: periplasmic heavy metal sensor [Thermoanaerobaculia bacterium]
MRKRTLGFTAAAALVVMLAVPFAYAQHMRHGGGHVGAHGELGSMMMLGHLERVKQAAGLSDQQVTDIKAIFENLKQQNAPYRDSLKGGMASVAQTLLSNPNDLAAAQAILDRQSQAEQSMKSNALAAASKALNVMTPDQRIKLADHLKEHLARMR